MRSLINLFQILMPTRPQRRTYTRSKYQMASAYKGLRPPKSKPANKKNMAKTTRRGAYKPARKKQMAIRRAPRS